MREGTFSKIDLNIILLFLGCIRETIEYSVNEDEFFTLVGIDLSLAKEVMEELRAEIAKRDGQK